jgi:ornithine carbamoyltransferase
VNHFLSAADLTQERALHLFRVASALKQGWKAGRRGAPLAARTLALIFEKPSLRTRVTLEVGIVQLGGRAVHLSGSEIGLGTRESVPDVARNLSRWVDGIAARVYSHDTVETLARHAAIPVINGLSDFEHPCQALADYFTLWERGIDLARMRLAWIGDGNNVCHSLLLLGALLGTTLTVACPPGYEPHPDVQRRVAQQGGHLTVTYDAREAATGADVLYTDVWISMGQEAEQERRREAFSRYQLNERLMGFAKPAALVMHCLPAHRGE